MILQVGSGAIAQNLSQTVRGVVIDAASRQPIIGAAVIVLGTDPVIGAITNEQGSYQLERVPVGQNSYQVSFLGFGTVTVSNRLLSAGKELVLNVTLQESNTRLDEVVVHPQLDKTQRINEMALVSSRSFTLEETSRYAGSFSDPARMAGSFAGVSDSQDDAENAIIIRGNSPKGVLWRLEGVEVPNPNHFSEEGAANGAISMLNSNMLDNSDFFTGAFPAEYGNALSGVFDLRLRNGNNSTREYAVQAGLLGLEFAAEGPIKTKNPQVANASYLFNYRYSTIALLESLNLVSSGEGAAPVFQDLSFKFSKPTSTAGTFSLWGLNGSSRLRDADKIVFAGTEVETAENEDYLLSITGLNHMIPIGTKAFLESALNVSHTRFKSLNEGFSGLAVFSEDQEGYTSNSIRLSSSLTQKLNTSNLLKTGTVVTLLGYDLNSQGLNLDQSPRYFSSESGTTAMLQLYMSHRLSLWNKLQMTGGVHYIRLHLNGQDNLEPRFAVRYATTPKSAISFGYGKHSRREEISLYFTQLVDANGDYYQPNRNLELIKSNHYVVGYELRVGKHLFAKLEAYYQELYDVPIEDRPLSTFSILNETDAFIRTPLVNRGVGENKGLEITLEKFFAKGTYFLVAGSLFDSKYKAASGEELNTRYNTGYQFNLMGIKEFKLRGQKVKRRSLTVGLENVISGGRRIIPVDLSASIAANRNVLDFANAYSRQLPAYNRIDFQLTYKVDKPKYTRELKLDIQNVGGELYPTEEAFSPLAQTVTIVDFIGDMIPVLSYKVIF